jgi:hypothetical protein
MTKGTPDAPVIENPEAGWNRLRDRIVYDISQDGVILPQQLKIILGGIRSLRRLNVAEYESVGGASGLEALYVEQQVSGTSRRTGFPAEQLRRLLLGLIDPSTPTKTRSQTRDQLIKLTQDAGFSPDANSFSIAFQELERGEMVRSATEPESGLVTYRLDHDYLTRGVFAATRRANRWRYLLEEGDTSFDYAGGLLRKWSALLPLQTQLALAWHRLSGSFHYGQHQRYATLSLVRFAPTVLLLGVLFAGAWQLILWREQQSIVSTASTIWRKLEFFKGLGSSELAGAWSLAQEPNIRVREEFVKQLLETPEYAQRFARNPNLVVQSLVGINPAFRDRIAGMVRNGQNASPTPSLSIPAATIALQLETLKNLDPQLVIGAVKATKDRYQLATLSSLLEAVLSTIPLSDAQKLAIPLMEASAILAPNHNAPLSIMLTKLPAIATSDNSQAMIEQLFQLVTNSESRSKPSSLAPALEILARKLPPTAGSDVARNLIEKMKEDVSDELLDALAQGFNAIAPAPAIDDPSSLARAIIRAQLSGSNNPNLDATMEIVMKQMKPEAMRDLRSFILSRMNTTTNLSKSYIKLSSHSRFEDNYIRILDVMATTRRAEQLGSLLATLREISPAPSPENALSRLLPIVDQLKDKGNRDKLLSLSYLFAALMTLVPPDDKAKLASMVAVVITNIKDAEQLAKLTPAYAAIIDSLSMTALRALNGSIIDVVKNAEDGTKLLEMSVNVNTLPAELKKRIGKAIATPLIEAMVHSMDYDEIRLLNYALTAIMPEITDDHDYASKLLLPLLDRVKTIGDDGPRTLLLGTLSELTRTLEIGVLKPFSPQVIQALLAGTDLAAFKPLAKAFVRLTPRVK